MPVRRKTIRSLVERLLEEQNIRSGSVPVVRIADSLGIEVQSVPTEDELSGFLYRDEDSDLSVIGVNAHHNQNRQNFTVAHELGHFLLHDLDEIHVDRQFKVWLRAEASSEGVDIEEKEANLFAAELLMPAHFLEDELDEINTMDLLDEDVLAELAERYGVSTQAMTFRLVYLGYVRF